MAISDRACWINLAEDYQSTEESARLEGESAEVISGSQFAARKLHRNLRGKGERLKQENSKHEGLARWNMGVFLSEGLPKGLSPWIECALTSRFIRAV